MKIEAILTDGVSCLDNRRFPDRAALDRANEQVRALLGVEFYWEPILPEGASAPLVQPETASEGC